MLDFRPAWLATPSGGTDMLLKAGDSATVTVVCPPVVPNPAGRVKKTRSKAWTQKNSKSKTSFCKRCQRSVTDHTTSTCRGLAELPANVLPNFDQAVAQHEEAKRLETRNVRMKARVAQLAREAREMELTRAGVSDDNVQAVGRKRKEMDYKAFNSGS